MREAIDRLRRTSEQASSTSDYPLCLPDLPDWLLVILASVIPVLLSSSLILIGENSVGKTSLAMVLGMCFSRWHIGSRDSNALPSVRVTQDLDFLKAKAGLPEEPIIFDDGDVWGLKPTQLKALLDVQANAPMVRARYTAAKFSAGQLRIICDNSYDGDVAKELKAGPVDNDTFWKLISPAFHFEVRGAHIGAVMKRACFLVNTQQFVVVKVAKMPGAMAYPIPSGSMYVRDYAPSILRNFFQEGEPRANFEEIVGKEVDMMRKFMQSATNKRNAKDAMPPLPEVNEVQPPPNFKDMSWREVRDYIEKGHEEGLADPYPSQYPEHLKWSTYVRSPPKDVGLATTMQEKEFDMDPMQDAGDVSPTMPMEDDDFRKFEMPDSDDSFWKPLIKEEMPDEEPVTPGAPTSSANPPAYLLRSPVAAGGRSPCESAFCLDGEEPAMDVTEPFSQPPDVHTFLGFDEFADESDFMEDQDPDDGTAFSQPPDSQIFMDVDTQMAVNPV